MTKDNFMMNWSSNHIIEYQLQHALSMYYMLELVHVIGTEQVFYWYLFARGIFSIFNLFILFHSSMFSNSEIVTVAFQHIFYPRRVQSCVKKRRPTSSKVNVTLSTLSTTSTTTINRFHSMEFENKL